MINLDNVKSIGRYKILRKLGHGSLGYVYLGRDPYIERKVAVKVYRPPQVNSPDEFERQEGFFTII